ncbi:hypothetical protein A2Y99_00490 [Candidatus Gottesmanbacteria bacterium RBG_13_37_7]|uniref:Rod shape-determining protein MreD n=1 Tax=Candidatus Gottesmanbacteria bacterium RBG_13_37_7 TaxID=1798369 RepID=A0A1F5YIP1_9BACT|nr:MAG: hypothetical protein A2Y99_00490 [Candidatus Gottesmanbacteria bacterium RBG_13_37_7]
MIYLLSLIFFISVIFESAVFSYPLTVLLVTIFSLVLSKKYPLLVFITGILLDVFLSRPLGSDSLVFLLIIFLAEKIEKKVAVISYIYLIIIILLVCLFYYILFYHEINYMKFIQTLVVSWFIVLVVKKLFPGHIREANKLEV